MFRGNSIFPTSPPDWWEEWNSQYGLLKMWKVTTQGSFVDGVQMSAITANELNIGHGGYISVRIGIKDNASRVGGINIFGRQFGNYPQDIVMRLRYRPAEGRKEERQDSRDAGIACDVFQVN